MHTFDCNNNKKMTKCTLFHKVSVLHKYRLSVKRSKALQKTRLTFIFYMNIIHPGCFLVISEGESSKTAAVNTFSYGATVNTSDRLRLP